MWKRLLVSVTALTLSFSMVDIFPKLYFNSLTVSAASNMILKTEVYDNLSYLVYNDHVAIISCEKSVTGNVIIPDTIDDLPVMEIFSYAFQECTSLVSVSIPKTVTKIGYDAFYRCHSLKSIDISENVESIGVYTFYGCLSLESINVNSNNKHYKDVGGVLFDKNMETLIQYPNNKAASSYTVPSGVAQISEYAFANSRNLVSVSLPDTVTNINNFTFCDSPNLKSVVLSKNITRIGESAFDSCTSLTLINIPEGITSIDKFAFIKCKSLTKVIIPDSVITLGNSAFSQCSALILVKLSKNISDIGRQAFVACTSLESIDIPAKVETIGEDAFYYCTSLKSVVIPENVKSLGSSAFSLCTALTSIQLKNKNCEIYDSKYTICNAATIYGYENSTAQEYSIKYSRQFRAFNETVDDYSSLFASVDEMRENLIALNSYILNKKYYGTGKAVDVNNSGNIDVFDVCVARRKFMTAVNSIYHKLDSDDNGFPDCLENDDRLTDSDGDGLSDYDELMYTATNPLLADSDNNGITDNIEDLDSDGLSNEDEIKHGTNPLLDDSDMDGLTDGEEIALGTDPNNSDTDSDGALDGWEIDNGYNPLKFNSSFDINTSVTADSVTASVQINGSGDITNTLEITPVEDNVLLESNIPGYIDSAFNFSTDADFSSATISFDFDSSLLTDSDFLPTIYYYNEETQMLEELDTTVSGNTASATVSHFSTYILLNKTEFDKVWEVEIREPNQAVMNSGMSVVYVLDYSGSMSDNDASGIRYSLTKDFIKNLNANKDLAGVILFNDTTQTISALTNDFELINSKLDSPPKNNDGTDGSEGMAKAIDFLIDDDSGNSKYIVFMTDGKDEGGNYYCSYDKIIERANNNNITIYTIGLGKNVDSTNLKNVSTLTKGRYFFSSEASKLVDIFKRTQTETIDYRTDSNNDGISDYYTKLISDGVLRGGTGTPIVEDYTYEELQASDDWDGDGMKNGEEITITATADKTKVYYSSVPTSNDSDKDGISDSEDTAPLQKGVLGKDGKIYCGELTIVSAHDSNEGIAGGHAWLVYKSYISDNINFSGAISRIYYSLYNNESEFDFKAESYYLNCDNNLYNREDLNNSGKYTKLSSLFINRNQYISIGARNMNPNYTQHPSKILMHDIANLLLRSDKKSSSGGIALNSEFLLQYLSYNKSLKEDNKNNDLYYKSSFGYTRQITSSELDDLLNYCKNNNYYTLSHSCATIAVGAWISAFGKSDGLSGKLTPNIHSNRGSSDVILKLFCTPKVLKEQISQHSNYDKYYSNTMISIMKNNYKSFYKNHIIFVRN